MLRKRGKWLTMGLALTQIAARSPSVEYSIDARFPLEKWVKEATQKKKDPGRAPASTRSKLERASR